MPPVQSRCGGGPSPRCRRKPLPSIEVSLDVAQQLRQLQQPSPHLPGGRWQASTSQRGDGGTPDTPPSPTWTRTEDEWAVRAVQVQGESAVEVVVAGSSGAAAGVASTCLLVARPRSRETAGCALAQSCLAKLYAVDGEAHSESDGVDDGRRGRYAPSSARLASSRKEVRIQTQPKLGREVAVEFKTELTHMEAFDLAEKTGMPRGQVTTLWKAFKCYDSTGRGKLSPHEFQALLRSMLRDQYPSVTDIPRSLFMWRDGKASEVDVGEDEEDLVDFQEFLTWISQHSFTEQWLLTPEQRKIRSWARMFDVPVPEVELIKRQYDRFDLNHNGRIEFNEFHDLLGVLLNTRNVPNYSLPERRTRSFWRDIDVNRDGVIDFHEFIPWYLRYFDTTGCPVGTSPLEEFYASIRPCPAARRLQCTAGLDTEPSSPQHHHHE